MLLVAAAGAAAVNNGPGNLRATPPHGGMINARIRRVADPTIARLGSLQPGLPGVLNQTCKHMYCMCILIRASVYHTCMHHRFFTDIIM